MIQRILRPRRAAPATPAPWMALLLGCGALLAGSALLGCGASPTADEPEPVELRPATRQAVAEAVAAALFQGAAIHEVRLVARDAVPPSIPPGTVSQVQFESFACESFLIFNTANSASQRTFLNGGVRYAGREESGVVGVEGCPLDRLNTTEPEFFITGIYSLQATVDYLDEGSTARFDVSDVLLKRPASTLDPDKEFIIPEPPGCPCTPPAICICSTNGPEPPVARRNLNSPREDGSFVCSDFETAGEQCRIESSIVDARGEVATATDMLASGERATGYDLAGRVVGSFGVVEVSTLQLLDFECPFECERCIGNPDFRENPPGCTVSCTEDIDNNDVNNDQRPSAGVVALTGANGSTGTIEYLDCNTYEVCTDNGVVGSCEIVSY